MKMSYAIIYDLSTTRGQQRWFLYVPEKNQIDLYENCYIAIQYTTSVFLNIT